MNLFDNLPADQIFNILSHDPLQNCVEIIQSADPPYF